MTEREYLESIGVISLQSAARMAGLKWKNGDPSFSKAGIIEALMQHASIRRACIAVLQNMERGQKPKVNLLDDLEDELSEQKPAEQGPIELVPSEPQRENPALRQSIDMALREIASLKLIDAAQQKSIDAAKTSIQSLAEAITLIQNQRPIQYTIAGVTLPEIKGQHEAFPRMVRWLSMRDVNPETRKGPRTHVLLVGPASSGKTTAALEFAKLKALELYAQPLSMDSFAVTGYTSPDGKRIETEFTRAWINGGVFLWDEMSMSAPEALGTLNSALANGFIPIPGLGTVYAHPDFYMIAGDNSDTGASLKYGARSLLDGASLDRFVRIDWQIDPTVENSLGAQFPLWLAAVRAIRAEITKRDIAHVGATMRAVITGSMALASGGFSRREILEDTCKKGVLCEQWQYFEQLAPVQSFLRS